MTLEHYAIVILAGIVAYLALVILWRWYFHDCAQPLPETVAELLQDDKEKPRKTGQNRWTRKR